MIRLYGAESLTNQMSKDEIMKKINYRKVLKKMRAKKQFIRGQIKIWFDMCSIVGCNFFFRKKLEYRGYFNMYFYTTKIISVNQKVYPNI